MTSHCTAAQYQFSPAKPKRLPKQHSHWTLRPGATKLLQLVIIAGCLMLSSTVAQAGIVIPGSVVEGKPIADWTGDWWNWAVTEGFPTSPLTDTTGEFANLNQAGPIFFMAGNLGDSTPYVRTFDVPDDKYLLVPITNWVFWAPEDGADEATIRNLAVTNTDMMDNLFFELDGTAIADPTLHRETTPDGGFTLEYGQLLADIGLTPMDRLAVSDGYWVMIEPLTRGNHQIRFGARFPGEFETNLTLNLNVVPEPSAIALLGCALGIGLMRRGHRSRG